MVHAFAAAGWDTADAITLKTAIEIGESVLFDRPYPDAPVSRLLFEGRAQDLAFEKPVGDSADRRHHVRFWQTDTTGDDGRPLWLGAASFDRGVGLSHDTGAITHHIGPDLDAERDSLIADLSAAGMLLSTTEIAGIGATKDRPQRRRRSLFHRRQGDRRRAAPVSVTSANPRHPAIETEPVPLAPVQAAFRRLHRNAIEPRCYTSKSPSWSSSSA